MSTTIIFDKVSVVGLGYVGLPTAAVIASRKVKVVGVDVNQHAVDIINQGNIHIVEPELDTLVHSVVKDNILWATTKPEPADAFLIAVPTPFKDNHEPDLSFIEQASKAIAAVLEKGNLVILESTSPVDTTEQMSVWMAECRPDLTFPHSHGEKSDIRVAYCPERILPGRVVRELVENDRVVGGMTPACSKAATALYKIFVQGECIAVDARTAEMCKLTENSFRDVNIAFANELSNICDQLDVDVWELIQLANRHPRVEILQPGCGVGGHCIAVDPWFIISKTPEEAKLMRCARETNDSKPNVVTNAIISHAKHLKTKQIACLGITYKPDIDDLRESPALKIVLNLTHMGYRVKVVEPNIDTLPELLDTAGCQLVSLEEALRESKKQLIAVLVAHKEFKASKELRSIAALYSATPLVDRYVSYV